jgi:peptide deformylase
VLTIPRKEQLMIYGPQMVNVESEPVYADEYHLLPELRRYMIPIMEKHNGIGLSAPQVGVFKQFFIMRKDEGNIVDVVNPVVTRMYGIERPGFEACLSLPPSGNGCKVSRCDHVQIEHSTSKTQLRQQTVFSYMDSRVAQHEYDHLTGTFFIDRVHARWQREILDEFYKWREQSNAKKYA